MGFVMRFDPKDTEKYREETFKKQPHYSSMKTRMCLGCRKLRSVTQYSHEDSKICNHCKRSCK